MKAALFSTVALLALSFQPAVAMDSMSAMPMCVLPDVVVGVNTMNKTFMTMGQMKTVSAGMSSSQVQAMMAKNHVKMMCKSKAQAVGAKPNINVTNSSVPGSPGYSGSAPAPH